MGCNVEFRTGASVQLVRKMYAFDEYVVISQPAMSDRTRAINSGSYDFYFAIDKGDVGKVIGKGGKQAKFILERSGLEVFSVRDGQEFISWGRTWVNMHLRGSQKAIETAMLLVESTRRSYFDSALQSTREQLETALGRIQQLEETADWEEDEDMDSVLVELE